MAGNSVITPTTANYMYAAVPDIMVPRIDPALSRPYDAIEDASMVFRNVMALMGNESATYLNRDNAVDTKDRTIKSYLISVVGAGGVDTATTLTIDAASLGPNPVGAAPDQRHEFFVGDTVYAEIVATGARIEGRVTAVPATNQITVIGQETGTDFAAALVAGTSKVYPGSVAKPSGSTTTRYGFFVGTTRTNYDLQIIRHAWKFSGTLENMSSTWYGTSLEQVTPGQGIYWTNDMIDDQWNMYQRKKDIAHLLSNPNNQNNADDARQMTGVWYSAENDGVNYSIGGGWNNLVLQDFTDYFDLHISRNLGVTKWMGMVDTSSCHVIDNALVDWGLGGHLFSMGNLGNDKLIQYGFKGFSQSTGYGIQWSRFQEFDNAESVFDIDKGKMYCMPVGTVPTSAGQRPYVEMLYLAGNGNDRKDKFSRVLGASNDGEVATIEDSNTYQMVTERGNLLRVTGALGVIDGR